MGGDIRAGVRELSNRHSLPLALPSALDTRTDTQKNNSSLSLDHQLVRAAHTEVTLGFMCIILLRMKKGGFTNQTHRSAQYKVCVV